jgi:hypothetical protein
LALLLCLPCSALAQRTVVEKNGVGGRIETDYNPAGKVTEMRTIGADGKLQQKADYEYLPGYYGAQQTDTTYWPNAQVHKVVRHTYDQSTNFTGEFGQLFDETGKQIGGHKLTRDPMTGEYRCAEWNVATQSYKAQPCPAGEEESGGKPDNQPRKFTYDEIVKVLDAARNTARQEQTIRRRLPMTPIRPPITIEPREVGFVLPAQLKPGQRASGTITENPTQYEGMPAVRVALITIPFESAGEASRLFGWRVEIAGEAPQTADGPITLVVPNTGTLNITLTQSGNPVHKVTQSLDVAESTKRQSASKSFQAAAFCLKASLCAVAGPLGGDSTKTFASFEDRPATIVAETPGIAYLAIPELTASGLRSLYIATESTVAAAQVVVGDLVIKNKGRALKSGEALVMTATLDGPNELPDSAWKAGNFPGTNLERARELIPDFQLRKRDHDDKEGKQERESDGGEILVVLQNANSEDMSLGGSANQSLIFHLTDRSFERGEFKYNLLMQAKQPGKAEIKASVIPLLAPIAVQQFAIPPTKE